jgi:hypothetical protein
VSKVRLCSAQQRQCHCWQMETLWRVNCAPHSSLLQCIIPLYGCSVWQCVAALCGQQLIAMTQRDIVPSALHDMASRMHACSTRSIATTCHESAAWATGRSHLRLRCPGKAQKLEKVTWHLNLLCPSGRPASVTQLVESARPQLDNAIPASTACATHASGRSSRFKHGFKTHPNSRPGMCRFFHEGSNPSAAVLKRLPLHQSALCKPHIAARRAHGRLTGWAGCLVLASRQHTFVGLA